MAGADRRTASQRTAAHLIASGYPHGRRASSPTHNNYPANSPGSAAYRRLMAAMGRNQVAMRGAWHPFRG